MKAVIIGLWISLLSLGSFGQEEVTGKHSVSLNFGGTSIFIGLGYEYHFNTHLQLDAGIGYAGGGVALNYYPWGVQKGRLRPFIGISPRVILFSIDHYYPLLMAPIGVSWKMNKSFNIGMAIEPGIIHAQAKSDPGTKVTVPYFWGNLKLSYRFDKQ